MKTNYLYPIRELLLTAFAALILSGGAVQAQTTEPMGVLRGTLETNGPTDALVIRLIGLPAESGTPINPEGDFILEAPARAYAGLVVQNLETGELRLIEREIEIPAGRILALGELALEAPAAPDLPFSAAPEAPKAPTPETNEAILNEPFPFSDPIPTAQADLDRRPLGPARMAETPALNPATQPPAEQIDPIAEGEVHPLLVEARMMAERGNFAGADKVYERFLELFPLAGPIMVEHGVMVFHNIQQAKGRSILREAAKLPGLGPMEITALDAYLQPPVVVIHEAPERRRSYAQIRIRHRHHSH